MGITEWIEFEQNKDGTHSIMCSSCGGKVKSKGHARSIYTREHFIYCPYCGSRMQSNDRLMDMIGAKEIVDNKGE